MLLRDASIDGLEAPKQVLLMIARVSSRHCRCWVDDHPATVAFVGSADAAGLPAGTWLGVVYDAAVGRY
jgi:hypothetical protein